MKLEMIFHDFPVLQSKNIVLKKIEQQHLQDLYKIYNNKSVFEYCGITPKHNIQTVSKMIGHFERDYHKKSRIKWGIFRRNESDVLTGIIELMDFNQKVNMVTIGYYLAEKYWNKGIAAEAVQMLTSFLFETVLVNRIQAEVMPANEASKRVLTKNGFKKEGLIRQASSWAGKGVIDLEIYGLLQEDSYQRAGGKHSDVPENL